MRHVIADYLRGNVATLDWADKVGGVAFKISSDGKIYPVEVDASPGSCESLLKDFAPDSDLKSVMYFEDLGTNIIKQTSKYWLFESSLRLVGWLNYNAINPDEIRIENYAYEAISVLPNHFNDGYVRGATVHVVALNYGNIFHDYTYNIDKQYWIHPYGAFTVDLRVTYRVGKECKELITLNPALC